MAAEFIPTVMARGFHAGPVFGIFGAAIAAAKIGGLDARADPRRDRAMRQPRLGQSRRRRAAAAACCARAARCATRCSPSRSASTARRAARRCSKARPASITPMPATTAAICATALPATTTPISRRSPQGLGRDWIFLETLYRIYSTAGYNIAHIDVTAALCAEHAITYDRDRPHRGRRQLAGDRVSEPAFPEPRHREPARASAAPNISPPMAR